MILETIPAIQMLTVDQKLRLVWELWNEVSRDASITSGTESLLNERLAEYEANPTATRTTDEVTAGIMRLKQSMTHSSP